MSQTVPSPGRSPASTPGVVRVTKDLYLAAARRLVSQLNPDIDGAAKRLVESAPRHGIDLSLCFVTLEAGGRKPVVGQACLAVKGAGRTAMLFISEPRPGVPEGDDAHAERVACIDHACACLTREHGDQVKLAQTLPEPEESWTLSACDDSGFMKVGDLSYLRAEARSERGRRAAAVEPIWPEGITVKTLRDAPATDAEIIAGLEASYEDTLDCPELCGVRETSDVLDSHRATGTFDPSLWWLVRVGDRVRACMFFSRCSEQKAVELVYLGLARELRGAGLGRALLAMGMDRARRNNPSWAVTCAVDERNVSALRLYGSAGFTTSSRRVALVKPV